VQLVELENSLPNGFHDAFLESLHVDYSRKRAVIKLRICVGNPDAADKAEREAYREANLELVDLTYLVIDPPGPGSDYAELKKLWVDGGEANTDSGPPAPVPAKSLPPGVLPYWFFVREWNSFIHIAAKDAKIHWSVEAASAVQ
jgi:hypothetical protein